MFSKLLVNVLAYFLEEMKKEVCSEEEDYLINVDENKYIEKKIGEYIIKPIKILRNLSSSTEIKRTSMCSVKKQTIRYTIVFEGDEFLFACRPSSFTCMHIPEIKISDGKIIFELTHIENDVESFNKESEELLNYLESTTNSMLEKIGEYNIKLPKIVKEIFIKRKKEILDRFHNLSKLNIPIKKNSVPNTYSVPNIEVPKPIDAGFLKSKDEGYNKIIPILSKEEHMRIIKIINTMGNEFSKKPKTYKNKGEEELRDHILMVLQPNFENSSVTGETFNKTGKTDILIKNGGTNLFIAECKFWNGKKEFHKAINQLISYLSWTDTKVALIIFVKKENFSDVLNKVKNEARTHSNFSKEKKELCETVFSYDFHFNGDTERKIDFSIMVYHTP